MPLDQQPQGYFLKTTDIIDTSRLYGEQLTDERLKEFFLVIVQEFNEVRNVINRKETGTYLLSGFVSGNSYFPNPLTPVNISVANQLRPSVTTSYFVGALANAGTITVPHGIVFNAMTTFTRIWGTANKLTTPVKSLPLPYINVTGGGVGSNIELYLDNTNIYISSSGNASAFTQNYVFVEYLQQ